MIYPCPPTPFPPIPPYPPYPPEPVNFNGYDFKLKKMYRQGKLPKDLVDIVGNRLTQNNLSGDHVIPHSQGGKTTDDNMMLATKQFNSMRGDRPLKDFITPQNLAKWVNQYLKLDNIDGFDFKKYVMDILKKIG